MSADSTASVASRAISDGIRSSGAYAQRGWKNNFTLAWKNKSKDVDAKKIEICSNGLCMCNWGFSCFFVKLSQARFIAKQAGRYAGAYFRECSFLDRHSGHSTNMYNLGIYTSRQLRMQKKGHDSHQVAASQVLFSHVNICNGAWNCIWRDS